MGNDGKMAGNSKICIGIQSQLILSEFRYHRPNANMADLSAGPGLVARKRG